MAKTSGLGQRLFVDGYNVSGDVGSVSRAGGSHEPLDITGLDKSAMERLLGKRDGALEFSSFFNDDATAGAEGVFTVLKSLPTTDRHVMYCMAATVDASACCLVSKQMNYDLERADSGALTATTTAAANGFGLEWGVLGTAGIRTDTTATNGASLDGGASSSFGLQAYLQVFALTGTSVTVKVQDSADNSTFADLTGATFTAATGRGVERVATAAGATVRRYLRVATTGTFTNAQFAVVLVRNETAVSF